MPNRSPVSSFQNRLRDSLRGQGRSKGKLLLAAMEVFAAKGLEVCTVEDLLQQGGVSRGSFYQHFQNKYEVAAVLFEQLQDTLTTVIRERSSGEREPLKRLQNAFDVYMETQIQIGGLYALLLGESKRSDSPLALARARVNQRMADIIVDTIAILQGRHIEPDVILVLILALEELTLEVHRRGPFTPDQAQHIRAVMLPILQRTMAPPGTPLLEVLTRK